MRSKIRNFLLILGLALVSTVPALATLPSGNGQTTSTKSVSVVFASDAPGITATVTGGATSAKQDTGNTSLATIATNTTGVATAANQSTGNTSLATIATNTTSIATAANQATGNTSLATIATNTTNIATAANQSTGNTSLATIATNTTGAATAANQSTGNTSLATIAASAAGSKTAGQATMANSVPVTLASNQSNINVVPQVSTSVDPGQNLSLSDTAAHAFASAAGTIGIMVSAPLGNTVAIYCALGSGVTSGNTGKGLELQPGDRELFPVANASTINCITATATQNVHAVAF